MFQAEFDPPPSPRPDLANVCLQALSTLNPTLAYLTVGGGRTAGIIKENLNAIDFLEEYNGTSVT